MMKFWPLTNGNSNHKAEELALIQGEIPDVSSMSTVPVLG
jgi:hypothetical protein